MAFLRALNIRHDDRCECSHDSTERNLILTLFTEFDYLGVIYFGVFRTYLKRQEMQASGRKRASVWIPWSESTWSSTSRRCLFFWWLNYCTWVKEPRENHKCHTDAWNQPCAAPTCLNLKLLYITYIFYSLFLKEYEVLYFLPNNLALGGVIPSR